MVFEETQHAPKVWSLAALAPGIVVILAALADEPVAAAPLAVAVPVTVAVAIWMWRMALETRVSGDAVTVRFRGLLKTRTIPISSIRQARARTYRPLMEYGGWGIKLGPSGWAYNVSGKEGVQLEVDGARRPLLIGSKRAGELAEAITSSPAYRPSGRVL